MRLQSKSVFLLRLLNYEDEGATILRNAENYENYSPRTQCHISGDLHLQNYAPLIQINFLIVYYKFTYLLRQGHLSGPMHSREGV